MKNYFRLIPQAGIFAFLLFIFSTAFAQTSPTISYQGILENNGAAVNGEDTMKILIYQYATGGTPLYTETQSVNVTNGIFNVAIGSFTPLLPTLDFTKQYYLAISVNGGPELAPRTLVSFAPYAFRALFADTSIYATKANVANGVSGGVVNSVNGETGSVTISGTNGITVSNNPPNIIISSSGVQSLNTAGGKLTLVGAGGTTVTDTGSVLTIRSATFTGGTGIQAIQNTDNAIAITNPSGPITTLGLAQQNATTGQMLTWNGSAWRPASAASFTGIQNTDSTITISKSNGPIDTIMLGHQNATSGQILVWNGSAWRPETVSGVGPDSIKDLGDARVGGSSLFLGAGAGTQGTGTANVGVGIGALANNTTGSENTAIGEAALSSNINGSHNTVIGTAAMSDAWTGYGSYNTVIGDNAMYIIQSDSFCTAVGFMALHLCGSSAIRSHIVGIGDSALMEDGEFANQAGDNAIENTAIGSGALRNTNYGAYNTGTGFQALHQNVEGYHNTAIGASALWNDTVSNNTAVGFESLFANTSGGNNTASGYESLLANTIGSNNTAFGYLALSQNTIGTNNAAFGDNTGPTASNLSNTTSLGSGAQASASNSVVLGNTNVTTLYCQGAYAATTANSANMVVNASGQIMRSTSSARYKTNIHDLDINTDRLYDLRPVSYTSKIDGKEYFGLVAEDVAKVLPDLAEYARSKDVIPGSTSDALIPDAVKYPMLSVLLLDELKKEHAQVESQAKIIADLERRMEAVEASQKAAR